MSSGWEPPVEVCDVPDYFGEWLEGIRDMRANERSMYLRVKEIVTLDSGAVSRLQSLRRFASRTTPPHASALRTIVAVPGSGTVEIVQ